MLGSAAGISPNSSSANYLNLDAQRGIPPGRESSPAENHKARRASYPGMGTTPRPELLQAARRIGLGPKLKAALARMQSESANNDDKLGVISVLTAFDNSAGSLTAAIKDDQALAIEIGEALEAQCKLLNVGNRSVDPPLSLEAPKEGHEADLLRHIETHLAYGPQSCYVGRKGYEMKRFLLNAHILKSSSDSNGATLALKGWCNSHALAGRVKVTVKAKQIQIEPKLADEELQELRKRLQVGEKEEVKYRRVKLHIEGNENFVLSEADNLYVPHLLSEDMRRALDETDTPFGIVVADLNFYRRTFWVEMDAEKNLLVHRAILYSDKIAQDGTPTPFSVVQEFYQMELMDFPPKAAASSVGDFQM